MTRSLLFFIFLSNCFISISQQKIESKSDSLKKLDTNKVKVIIEYHENKRVYSETPLMNGLKNGIVKRYYEDGKLEIASPYKNDTLHGIEYQYHENGKPSAINPYNMGQPEGLVKTFYQNGKLASSYNYNVTAGGSYGVGKSCDEKGHCDLVYYYKGRELEKKDESEIIKFMSEIQADTILYDLEVTDGIYKTRHKQTKKWGLYQYYAGITKIIPMNYDSLSFFRGPFALVWNNGRIGTYLSKWEFEFPKQGTPCEYEDGKIRTSGSLYYFAVKKNNKWGLVNWQSGDVEVDFLYDSADEVPFVAEETEASRQEDQQSLEADKKVPEAIRLSRNLFPVVKFGKYGYMDSTGKLVIGRTFDHGGEFSEGLAPVKVGNKWGYIDKTGAMKIEAAFYGANEFYRGIASVNDGYNRGYISKTGAYLLEPSHQWVYEFKEGCLLMHVGGIPGGFWGYVDSLGNNVIAPKFENASNFSEGLAPVFVGGYWGYINKQDSLVIKPGFEIAGEFSEGLAAVKKNGSYCYIDKTGMIVIKGPYKSAERFSEGMAAVQLNEKWGFISKNGKILIKASFNETSYFKEGLAAVRIDDKWGYVDATGKMVIQPEFDYAADFKNGLAKVTRGNKFGYINKTGKIVWKLSM